MLDFSDHDRDKARVESIEKIDLTGSGSPSGVRLDEHAVYLLTEQRADGKATLIIEGDGRTILA